MSLQRSAFEDIRLLLKVNQLADKGNTVIVIEHNLDVIKTDWIIDLGPKAAMPAEKVTEGT
jgi:excinuclease ABC subunit A